uniref:Pleckstrin homology domain containing, family A member 5 n=1 Tax=Oncorhynchus mykiss TaxID=8022 RepID=A0A8C7UMV4_ONCMY
MAADLNPDWLSCLPSSWSYGVTRDGRIFFINEEAKSTTWLHPVTGEAVITGHRKTPDLPTGWEEGYTFEGARCFINHNERKVTCKHPVSGLPSQDNCIFVVNEQVKKERPMSTMSEASNFTGGSDYSTYPGSSPATRPSRSYKKVHNFGKRSNSIKRNPNAPAVKSNWLYKQDSTGMKLWKKRWFVLSDMCLFYYRDEKEEGILGSILLPSFHISMLSVDDHISRKYAFKATHSNMRTYYFCTDTAKDMESWMKVMTDAALVHTEPIRRWLNFHVDRCCPQEVNNILNHNRVLTRPEIQNNERNREPKHNTLQRERERNKYGFQRDGSAERPLTKINSIKLQPAQAAAIAAAVTASRQVQVSQHMAPPQVNGSGERAGDHSPGEVVGTLGRGAGKAQDPPPNQTQNQQAQEPEKSLTRTNSMRQLENWVRTQRTQEDDDTRSITSYQTLPRNMPSHRAQIVPRYPEGYRTLPRNMLSRPESICSVAGSVYDRALAPTSNSDKRRSMRDDTMWQLYEWQQRQAFSRQGPPPPGHYGTLPSPKTMGNISVHQGVAHSIPTSPSHGSLALYHTFSPPGQHRRDNPPGSTRSEVSSPVFRGDQTMTIDRRHRTHLTKYNYPPDRRSMPAGIPVQTITPQSLQGKTPEELTLLLIKLRRQQAELNSIREHTVAQLMILSMEGPNSEVLSHHLQRNLMYLDSQTKDNEPLIFMIHTMIENSAPRPQLYQQVSPEDYKDNSYSHQRPEDIDTKLSRLCEQDQVVRTQEEKLQQLHREKHTLETALLSASQEIEQSSDNPAAVQSLIQQRDVLQNGLLSTCRELARVNTVDNAELERSWREYDKMESGVSLAKTNLLEQLEALGSPQTEPPSQQHVHIQKELWRIQDVMEVLAKNKPQRTTDTGFLGSKPISNLQKNEGDRQPPRPPLPQSYGSTERPPAVPPLPSPSGTRPPLHTSKHGQRNGTHSSQGPDYRLYKSEPELTTVAEEVDDNNGEDNDKDRLQTGLTTDKEPAATKGVPVYPVGIVPPRTKSPMIPPESCTIASYVTLRKSKKSDPRTERPHSAVEQTCGPGERESGRARMSVEEQLERIRRHQQASLKEKKRSSSSISPSRSPSFSKENPFITQVREALDIDTAAVVELEMEITVVEEISYRAEEVDVIPVPRLSEEEPQPRTESSNMDTEVRECSYSHRPPESRICMADYHLIRMLMTSRSGD